MKEIAQHLRIASPTATTFVDRLIAQKVVERKSDAKNRKIVKVHLTTKGAKMLSQQFDAHHKALRKLFATLNVQDQKSLARILETILTDASSSHHD